jgi:hypothetical protein
LDYLFLHEIVWEIVPYFTGRCAGGDLVVREEMAAEFRGVSGGSVKEEFVLTGGIFHRHSGQQQL